MMAVPEDTAAAERGDGIRLERRRIGKVDIHVLLRSEAIDLILDRVRRKKPLVVAFCNAHTINLAARDPKLARILESALVLNDGVGVDLASRILHGEAFPENLNGTDLVPALLEGADEPLRLFLLGSAPGVAASASAELARRFPEHGVVGTHHGFFSAAEDEKVAELIARSDPDLILVGMGQPRQEVWAARYFEHSRCVTMCVGAFLDFTAGTFPRAPRWVRRFRMEWAYRLIREPRRLARRYVIGNVEFLLRLVPEYLGQRRSSVRNTRKGA